MSKKIFLLLSILIVSVMFLSACGTDGGDANNTGDDGMAEDEWGYITFAPGETIKLAVSSAMSGGYAVYGQDMANGVEMAIADFGGSLLGWDVIVEAGDDGCEGAPAVTVAEQFSADPTVLGVIGPMCSGSVFPASDIYADHNVLMITPSSTAVIITARGYENIFRTVANDDLQAEVTVGYLFDDLGLTTLGVLHDQSLYGEGIAQAVSDKFEAAGGSVLAFEGLTRGETDYSAVISTVLADNPEAVYWGGMDAEGALLINQMRAAGFEGIFFGPDGIKSVPTYIEASGGAAEGSFATFGAVAGAVGAEEWEVRFTELYGAPVAYGPGSYDSAMIILQSAEAVAFVDDDGNLQIPRKALAEQVRATPYDGVTGHLEFTETGDLAKVSITVFEVVDGDFVQVKTVDFGD
jgi:branched-chain amino acid transport system substrate-binding protein